MVAIGVDIQLKALKDCNECGVPLNVVSKYEHMPNIDSWHRLMKERCLFYFAIISFDHLPRMMVAHLMITVSFCVNEIVWAKGASKKLYPLTMIELNTIDFNPYFRFMHCKFVQTYEGADDTMSLRTIDVIAS